MTVSPAAIPAAMAACRVATACRSYSRRREFCRFDDTPLLETTNKGEGLGCSRTTVLPSTRPTENLLLTPPLHHCIETPAKCREGCSRMANYRRRLQNVLKRLLTREVGAAEWQNSGRRLAAPRCARCRPRSARSPGSLPGPVPCHRREICHSAAPPSPFSRRFNRKEEAGAAK